MPTKTVKIDTRSRLAADIGHNRWHEAIPPVLEVEVGEVFVLETTDGLDGQLTMESTADDVGRLSLGVAHPMTGPVFVRGASPGDLLHVEVVEIEPDPFDHWGYTVEIPGFGLLRDEFPDPFIVHWRFDAAGFAESEQIAGVRIPCGAFPGTLGVAPSRELRERIAAREQEEASRGGIVMPPDRDGACPDDEAIGATGLRTIPSRENGGNIDIKQLTPGATAVFPVYVQGALISVGDLHYAQGDGEVCGTGIEMRGRIHLRAHVENAAMSDRSGKSVQFYRDGYFAKPDVAVPRNFFATTGVCVSRDGVNASEDITLAAGNAVREMIDYLGTRGYSAQESYALCSVAVDLKISQAVDLPNVLVSAVVPLEIFQ